MKIQLDFDNKIIKVEDGVVFGELIEKLNLLNIDYKKWVLETNTTINRWSYPIIYNDYPRIYWEEDWWGNPSTYCIADTSQSIYHIEI